MPNLVTITIVGLIVLGVLAVVYMKLRRQDQLEAIMQKRRAAARLVSRAEYVEGVEKIPVALALTADTFYYENPDLDASFDLDRIEEIEYDDDLSTGRTHGADSKVLRLRSHGAAFEFLLDKAECEKWKAALPPRAIGSGKAAAV